MFESVSNHTAKSRPTRRKGSVLLIVLAVVLFLFGLAIIGPHRGRRSDARVDTTRIQMNSLRIALNKFTWDTGRFPTTTEGLAALIVRPPGMTEAQWRGPYLDALPKDAFGRDFHYAFPGVHGRPFDLGSSGRDKTWGTPDDITNAPSP